jgi:UDP-N-acetyl-2-amino-2-deoxyglucuronate dehydrogenase
MEKRKFGFAIIGTGGIAGIHAQAIEAIENAKLIGVYSVQGANEFASEHNCKAYDTIDELLKLDEIDIVCICTPSGAHSEPALQSIAAGKHCLIEKPLEVNIEKSDKIIAAAEKHGVTVAAVYPGRFYEVSLKLKDAVNRGRFGKMVLGNASVKWNRSEAYYNSAAWRGTWELDGGGALMNQGVHSVDMLQWLMGPVDYVQAITANVKHKNIEVEDTVVATVKFKNGALGTIQCSTAVFPGEFKQLEIMGTTGTVIMEDNHLSKWQFEIEEETDKRIREDFSEKSASKGGVSDPLSISYWGHQKQMEDIIHAIETGTKPLVDAYEARKSVEIVLAIYESAHSGKLVKL